jgi:hypothetical protein
MKTYTDIRFEGIRVLMQVLGTVKLERFITLNNRERFDYTEWRKSQWQDETVASLATRARALRENDSSQMYHV